MDGGGGNRTRVSFQPSPEHYNTYGYVYLVRAADGPIKIGTATDPRSRLESLQTAHHEALELLAVIPGGYSLERLLHHHFAPNRIRGEWYVAEALGELIALADYINARRSQLGHWPAWTQGADYIARIERWLKTGEVTWWTPNRTAA